MATTARDDPIGANDVGLNAYGDAFDVAVRVPTLMGAVVAAIAVSLVWTWRPLARRSSS